MNRFDGGAPKIGTWWGRRLVPRSEARDRGYGPLTLVQYLVITLDMRIITQRSCFQPPDW
jgi:hypothetical protein